MNTLDSYFIVRYTDSGQFFEVVTVDLTASVIFCNNLLNKSPHVQPTIHNHMFHTSFNEQYELHTIYNYKGYILSTVERLNEL